MKQKIGLFLCLALLLTGCSYQTKTIRFGAADIGGMYYTVANAYAGLASKESSDLKFEVKNTAGSAANLRLLSGNYIDLGIAQADLVRAAYEGTGRHGLYGCKPFLRFLVYRYDNESGGYCAAEQLENDGNEFKLCSTQCDYRAAFDEIFRRLRKLHRRRLHKGGNFICDLCFAIVLFCICKLQGNHQAGSRCYQGIRWNKYQNSIIK